MNKKKAGRLLDGRTYDEMPDSPPSPPKEPVRWAAVVVSRSCPVSPSDIGVLGCSMDHSNTFAMEESR